MTLCPVCGRRAIGKVGAEQYYCWDCCVEFRLGDENISIFNVELDGTLTLCANPMPGTVNLEVQKG